MRYLVSSNDVFNALGSVRAGFIIDNGSLCCNHSCFWHECSGHADIQNYVMRPPDELAKENLA